MRVVIPAYILSELKAGFAIGAVLFLPFLLIDMVTAAMTTSIGMFQLPPVVVSTPLKILLFVMVDGWNLLAHSVAEEFLGVISMSPDVVAELLRQLMKEAMILTAPVLIAAVVLGFGLTLLQTLTSLQDQSLTSVPRLLAVAVILLVGMPWFLGRMTAYAEHLMSDLHRYLG